MTTLHMGNFNIILMSIFIGPLKPISLYQRILYLGTSYPRNTVYTRIESANTKAVYVHHVAKEPHVKNIIL
jgi:hypothetical protein